MKERVAILISGKGTTMQEVIKASQSGKIPIDIACILSSSPAAPAIEIASRLGIPNKDIIIVNPNNFKGKNDKINLESFGSELLKVLKAHGATVITQNGWMPLTPENVIDKYSGKIFNQHPGPVPEFGGRGMYGRRIHAARLIFVRSTKRDYFTEAVVQRVDKKFDQGAVIYSRQINILPEDTVDDLQMRVLPIEHQIQIEFLKDFASGNIKEVKDRKGLIRPGEEKILHEAKKIAQFLYPHG